MKTISRYIMTLALLLTAVGGAWADETLLLTIESKDNTSFLSGSKTFDDKVTVTFSNWVSNDGDDNGWYADESLLTVAGTNGYTITSCKFYTNSDDAKTGYTVEGESPSVYLYAGFVFTDATQSVYIGGPGIKKIEVYTAASSASDPKVDWDAAKKTGTFKMPGSDVVLTPIYAKAAAFATTGTDPEVKTLLPEAAEGVIAGTDASLIAEGTGIVAFAAASTEVTQGTLMYAIGTSATQAPALTAFSATVPTAKNVADDGATLYVWYYIQGADTPDGQQATEDNTFNDSEPACLTVTVLTNKFDIQFNAANANTIEAGKATVTVGGTAATVTEGKLEGVKMGTEVKLKAKDGYKFRKVEVKKSDGSKRLDESTVGMIVCTNGKAYPVNMKDNLPSGVTAVGIVAYKNGKNGLVMALTDEATNMNWDTATGNNGAKAHTPAVEGYSWKVPTLGEWQYNIFTGAGIGNLAGLSTYMTAAGGTGLQNGCYWTSTPKNNSYYACCIKIENGSITFSPGGNTELKTNGYHVRAVFAF
ncbi:DUF1566 domain-containing protein [Prevotella communis]|uniref:DUF1566 domain-containing protein n=1 Tax=Prevotella communis TaxID=2913614 RepID=UPI001EDB5BCE|nr:DUF1566 domain-containing protein [Prevotella communis]UKK57196.1 DUF1566 domain-containing protein [Prevotella communis]UKK62644.1 DUF1566 domain-containing protein [Prevotella communis]UKK65469.1 DUF1566 domain-containing protein [Prevotella communis]